MTKIPKNPNQKFNGIGVSVLGLLLILIALPFTTNLVIALGDLSGEADRYNQYEDGAISNWASVNNIPTGVQWLQSGSQYDEVYCHEQNTDNQTIGDYPLVRGLVDENPTTWSFGTQGVIVGGNPSVIGAACNGNQMSQPFMRPPTTAFSNDWVFLPNCGHYGNISNCGDDGYSLAYTDSALNMSSISFNQIKFVMRGVGYDSHCNDLVHGFQIESNISLDYSIDIQIWKYHTFFTLDGYDLAEYHPSVLSGVSVGRNFVEDTTLVGGRCVPYYEVVHDLSFIDRLDISKMGWDEYYDVNGQKPIITFILNMDELWNEDMGSPLSATRAIMPFQLDSSPTSNASTSPNAGNMMATYFTMTTMKTSITGFIPSLVIGGIGVVFWMIAIASTPAWNPINKYLKGGLN